MAARKNQDPNKIRGVFGTVVSLDLRAHRCVISMDLDLDEHLGSGILNTTNLEDALKGVSDFNAFIGKNKHNIVTVVPLSREKSKELNWSSGNWEVIAIRPISRRPNRYQLPGPYRSSNQWKGSYCEQALGSPRGLPSAPPAEKVASVIHVLRKLLDIWGSFPISELQRVLQRQEEFADVVSHFGSISDIVPFIRAFPQYFLLTDNGTTLCYPFRSPENEFKRFLTEQGRSIPRRKTPPAKSVLIIETVDECRRHVRKLLERARKVSDTEPLVIAIDCEGDHLGKEGPLTLLQIGTVDGEAFVFDVLATPQPQDMFIDGELKVLLEEKKILKAAYTTIWEQCSIFAGPYRPKLSSLIEIYQLSAKHKTAAFEDLVYDKQIFAKRPLTKEMIQYAADDVHCLIPVIYEALNKLISPLWRPQFKEKMEKLLAESRLRDPHEMYAAGKKTL